MEHIFCKRDEWELHGMPMLAGWYFWDESDAYCHGPFMDKQEVVDAMNRYAEDL